MFVTRLAIVPAPEELIERSGGVTLARYFRVCARTHRSYKPSRIPPTPYSFLFYGPSISRCELSHSDRMNFQFATADENGIVQVAWLTTRDRRPIGYFQKRLFSAG
jgi:hypothetical protein